MKGLDVFRAWFADYPDQYILIGGTAATLAMEEAGLDFRATKDLDVVLHVEALTPAFGETFWRFIEAGGYEIRQASDTGKPAFYRFQKPTDNSFPVMVELFSRAPDSLRPIENGQLTPIPFDEAVSSLSAILLDDAYYAFIMAGRREIDGLPWKNIDFEHRQIIVDQAVVNGVIGETKTSGSNRIIQMNQLVYDALIGQQSLTKRQSEFVFCTKAGTPLNHRNVTRRVWYPLLRYLKLDKRNPYQSRHTAATLWLAAGESPEWIAAQMGHSNTKMLFTVYSRYVPNLTRQDGSALDKLLIARGILQNV